MSQEGFETSAGAQFSPEFNVNETTFTELPSRRKDSKTKNMSLLAKRKNLTELCYNICVKEEQTLDEITSLVDEALSVAREKLEAKSEGLVERNTETPNVKQTESTSKDYVLYVSFHSQGNQLNIRQVVALALQQIRRHSGIEGK